MARSPTEVTAVVRAPPRGSPTARPRKPGPGGPPMGALPCIVADRFQLARLLSEQSATKRPPSQFTTMPCTCRGLGALMRGVGRCCTSTSSDATGPASRFSSMRPSMALDDDADTTLPPISASTRACCWEAAGKLLGNAPPEVVAVMAAMEEKASVAVLGSAETGPRCCCCCCHCRCCCWGDCEASDERCGCRGVAAVPTPVVSGCWWGCRAPAGCCCSCIEDHEAIAVGCCCACCG
mmetsp:Transcript_32550/g.84348  ORF Transcript_32550/g.84348 Transcript_32550/m.84348 type:complete len:237 (-) Transcript_32550:295-1005(-)